MQFFLNDYMSGRSDLKQLYKSYQAIGTEGHDILAYKSLLEYARENSDRVKLHAGFLPRPFARNFLKCGKERTLAMAKARRYIAEDEKCESSEPHYNYFESMLTGRNMHTMPFPSSQFRNLFPVQLIKDCSMSLKIHKLLTTVAKGPEHKILVVCGVGHMAYNFGVPERLWKYDPEYKHQTYLIHTKEEKAEERFLMRYKPDYKHDLNWLYGGKDVADLVFVTNKLLTAYDSDDEKEFDPKTELSKPLSKETPGFHSNSDSEEVT
jgi:uncharacterized iron-regulated protein